MTPMQEKDIVDNLVVHGRFGCRKALPFYCFRNLVTVPEKDFERHELLNYERYGMRKSSTLINICS